MSEYQRYEFMTSDRPLTRAQLAEVNRLSSHIEASSTHAIIEYHWSGFGHNPIEVLHEYFDGFLYWANWGSPRLALRFPHEILPSDLIDGYDFDDFVTFTKHPDYDILDMDFGEMEAPDEWTEYDLGSLISIRDELMEGDLRALYIAWLATMRMLGSYDEEEEDEVIIAPPVPPAFATLTAAQQALAEFLQIPQVMLDVAAQHSNAVKSSTSDDFVAWVELLPEGRCKDYLVRLARNEPGLSRLLVKDLRELGQGKTKVTPSEGERVTYAMLLAETKAIEARRERERLEQEQLARLRHLQEVHDRQEEYWRRIEQAVTRKSGTAYDEAVRLLIDLRDAADHFKETQQFQARYLTWVRSYMKRPALLERLYKNKFSLPQV
jgi:hypothetical protein